MNNNFQLLSLLLLFLFKRENCQQTNVRIDPFEIDGLKSIKGRLEVFFNNSWGTICDDGFDNTNAYVVCKSLNFKSGRVLPSETYTIGKDKIWMDDVRCVGNEKTLFDCQYSPLGIHDCTHKQDVMITCTSSVKNQVTACDKSSSEIRLNGIVKGAGLVEVLIGGNWVSICDDYWDLNDAKVACRQLCYSDKYALPSINTQYQPPPRYQIEIGKLNCQGKESKITDCPYTSNKDTNCKISEASAVSCVQQTKMFPKEPTTSIKCSHSEVTAIIFKNGNSSIAPETLSFANTHDTCSSVKKSNDTSISITFPLGECGSESTVINSTHLLFSVTIFYKPISKDPIVRRNTIRMTFQCVYKRKNDIAQQPWQIQTVAVTESSVGKFLFRINFYQENSFTNVVTKFPMKLTLTTWLNVAIILMTDNLNLKLVVPACWVTTSQDKNSKLKYQLFENKCTLDRTLSFSPINQTVFGFTFQTFRFFNSYDPLYLHCSVFVCHRDTKSSECDRTCNFRKRRKRQVSQSEEESYEEEVISKAFILAENKQDNEKLPNVTGSTDPNSKEESTYLNSQTFTNSNTVLMEYGSTSQISTKFTPKQSTGVFEDFSTTPTDFHTKTSINTNKEQLVTSKTTLLVTSDPLQFKDSKDNTNLTNIFSSTSNVSRTSRFTSSINPGLSSNNIFFIFLITFVKLL